MWLMRLSMQQIGIRVLAVVLSLWCASQASALRLARQRKHVTLNMVAQSSALRQGNISPVYSAVIDEPEDTGTLSIPAKLPSSLGIDYVPLATMLATKDFLGADQFTRDNLIRLAGPTAVKRGFVYFTEFKNLPKQDLVTVEKLWLQFSHGHFGYSVQQRIWAFEHGNFDNFIRRIGWTVQEGEFERKRKWFGANEFIYELDKAPLGHLPLTSALRGTQAIKELMSLPLWQEYDWKQYDSVPWEVQ